METQCTITINDPKILELIEKIKVVEQLLYECHNIASALNFGEAIQIDPSSHQTCATTAPT